MTDTRNVPLEDVPARTFPVAARVVVAAAITLVVSGIYYASFGGIYAALLGSDGGGATPDLWTTAAQFGRNLVVAAVFAALLHRLGDASKSAALRLAALLWLGFQAMAVLGSVIHEHYPIGLYLLHVGDALVTVLIMALVLGRRSSR
jgi:hypothetical protein